MTALRKPKLIDYPTHQESRGGCKVSWYSYDKRKDAEAASNAARHNARILERQGYDWGYCVPGSINTKPNGRFEVCIP